MNQAALNRAKKIKFFLAFGFGFVFLSSTVALGVALNRNKNSLPDLGTYFTNQTDAITFEEFIQREFSSKTFNGSWWSDHELQWKDTEGNLVTWDLRTNETTVLVSQDLLTSVSAGAVFMGFSPDTNSLLFAYDIASVWRHSFTAKYVVFDSTTKQSYDVVSKDGSETLQYCDWVENKKNESILVYVSNNNIYWRTDNPPSPQDDLAVTADGETDNVFNGIPDWVYEEEVLGVNYAHYINDVGNLMAFAQFNDTLVRDFRYPFYGDQNDVFGNQYPEYKVVRYPKAGESNPTLKLFVWAVGEAETKSVVPPAEVSAWGEYIYTIADWTASEVLSVTWMNRIQTESIISECKESGTEWKCSTVFSEKEENGWIEIESPPIYSQSGESFIQILASLQASDSRHWRHIAKVDKNTGDTIFLTEGNFVVTSILSWQDEIIYFMGTSTDKPGSRQLYRLAEDGQTEAECVTCELRTTRGQLCLRNSVEFNWEASYYVHTCLGHDIPESVLRRASDNALVFVFEDNLELEEKLNTKMLPERIDTSVEVEGGFTAPVKIQLPPHMEEGTKYPVLVYVYGGPGSQQVTDSWTLTWGEYLVTSRNVIYVSIDGRGTGFQSNEHLFQVYKNLGTVEIQDQISVTQKLVETFDYMDPERVAIWGWSYGGFATAMTLEQDDGVTQDEVFKCGISVAPVSSWLLYDSIYTERYMALPTTEDNAAGYNHSLITTGIENLRHKKWMLNHGVADDNVHYQHSMLLTRALEENDIQFVQHSYPDENHGLGGVSRYVLIV